MEDGDVRGRDSVREGEWRNSMSVRGRDNVSVKGWRDSVSVRGGIV